MRVERWEFARYLPTCNIFYRREDLEAVGGFDETFTTGEDTDLGLRVTDRGAEIIFCPEALVYHDVTPSRFRSALRSATRWTDVPRVVRKHPVARRLLYQGWFWRTSHKKVLAGTLGIAVAPFVPAPVAVLALALMLPWIWHRLRIDPLCGGARRWAVLPGAFAIDLLETVTLVRGSLRHRALLL